MSLRPVEAACDSTALTPSIGDVAAKRSGLLPVLNSFATHRHQTFGASAVPLLVSAHPVLMGGLPVSLQQVDRETRVYT